MYKVKLAFKPEHRDIFNKFYRTICDKNDEDYDEIVKDEFKYKSLGSSNPISMDLVKTSICVVKKNALFSKKVVKKQTVGTVYFTRGMNIWVKTDSFDNINRIVEVISTTYDKDHKLTADDIIESVNIYN